MKTYKILSIVFIAICAVLMILLFGFSDFPAGQRVVFALCLCVVILLMSFNLRAISKKQKQE